MKVEYSHNNSGGDWWLKDKDWKALEKAGWAVDWYKNRKEEGALTRYEGGRFLGALASGAEKDFDSIGDAVREWEKITGMDASASGCNCCGAPHSFSAGEGKDWQYASGDNIVDVLYPDAPPSRRAAAERGRR